MSNKMSLWLCLISITNLVEEINDQILQGASQLSSRRLCSQDLQGWVCRRMKWRPGKHCINELQTVFQLLNEPALSGVSGNGKKPVKTALVGIEKANQLLQSLLMGRRRGTSDRVKLNIPWMAWSRAHWKSVERLSASDPKAISQKLRIRGLFFTE